VAWSEQASNASSPTSSAAAVRQALSEAKFASATSVPVKSSLTKRTFASGAWVCATPGAAARVAAIIIEPAPNMAVRFTGAPSIPMRGAGPLGRAHVVSGPVHRDRLQSEAI
jgi:hypothetical protein